MVAESKRSGRLEAEPAAPGLTGSQTLFVDAAGRMGERPTPGAEEARQEAFDLILRRGGEQIGDLFRMDEAVVPAVQDEAAFPVTNHEVFRMFDHDGDQRVSLQEIFPQDAAAPGPSPLVNDWLRDVRSLLRIGAANEDLVSISVPAVQDGDPRAVLFDFETLIRATQHYVHGPAAYPLVARLRLAQRTRNPWLRRILVDSYVRALGREIHRSVTRGHADSWPTARGSGYSCPPPRGRSERTGTRTPDPPRPAARSSRSAVEALGGRVQADRASPEVRLVGHVAGQGRVVAEDGVLEDALPRLHRPEEALEVRARLVVRRPLVADRVAQGLLARLWDRGPGATP